MTAELRRHDIIELIRKNGSVKVTELSDRYGISEVTIRSDLEILESQGSLTRIHGGAIGLEKLYIDMDLSERYNTNAASKRQLAARIESLIEDNDTIMMNAGTTLMYVLRAIKGKRNISIVTNSIANATEAASYPDFNVILLGGLIESKYQFTYGTDALAQLSRYHATKAILSVDGVHPRNGLTLYYASEIELVRKMIDYSDHAIITADSSKIGKSGFAKIASVSAADVIVTNHIENRSILTEYEDSGIKIIES